jgi:hypothetical protein
MNATVRRLTKHAAKEQPDVIVTKPMIGLTAMQACVRKGQSDAGILLLVNRLNPCGTSRGWVKIIHKGDRAPVQCNDYSDREHIILTC